MEKTIKTKDIYEATFYAMYGGKFAQVRSSMLPLNRVKHKGYKDQWTITMTNVPRWAIESWRTGTVYGSITDYVKSRIKLKKQIKRDLVGVNSR